MLCSVLHSVRVKGREKYIVVGIAYFDKTVRACVYTHHVVVQLCLNAKLFMSNHCCHYTTTLYGTNPFLLPATLNQCYCWFVL